MKMRLRLKSFAAASLVTMNMSAVLVQVWSFIVKVNLIPPFSLCRLKYLAIGLPLWTGKEISEKCCEHVGCETSELIPFCMTQWALQFFLRW